MIARLNEAGAKVTQKAYCDEQILTKPPMGPHLRPILLQIRTGSALAGSEVVGRGRRLPSSSIPLSLRNLPRASLVCSDSAQRVVMVRKVKGLIRDMIARLEKRRVQR